MKPLTYFVENDFSSAIMEVYGECLESLQNEIAWLNSIAFRLGLDMFESEGNLLRFREILQEYA